MSKKQFYLNIFTAIFIIIFTQSCNKNNPASSLKILYEDFCMIDSAEIKGVWNVKATKATDSNTGDYYSKTDEKSPYGITYKSSFHKDVLNKNIKVVIEAYVRIDNLSNKAGFGASITNNDSIINWFNIDINNHISKVNSWTFISDTLVLARSSVNTNNQFSFFLWNLDAKGVLEADDIHVKFIEINNPTYIPNVVSSDTTIEKGKQIYKNKYYTLFFNETAGAIFVCNNKGDKLINKLSYFIEYKKNQKEAKTSVETVSKFKLVSNTDSSFQFSLNDKSVVFNLSLFLNQTAELKFKTLTNYKTDLFIVRESIIANYNHEIDEVYTSNRKQENNCFQDEYWLNKEGLKIGNNINSMILYHLPKVSSIQVNKANKQLFINLDYNYDHLRMTFPLLKDTTIKGVKNDVSCNQYLNHSFSESEFSIFIGINTPSLPRFMKNPSGFLSTYIFTEHADFSDIRTQRAVNYGSEDIINFKDAIGGFAKYKIPVTKSAFYHNPDKTNNYHFNHKFNSEVCNIKNMPNYLFMLQEMHENGYEICLHTPEESTTKLNYLEEALNYFKTHFNSKSWIDHGYDNSYNNNREDLACDGFNKLSPIYAQPLLKKFNVNYFWNCYNEDSAVFSKYGYSNNIKHPYGGFGDFMPFTDYSKHLINNETVISWQASSLLLPHDDSMWEYYYNDKTLQTVANDYDVIINHCYPARVDSLTGFYDLTDKNKFVINNKFNNMLEKLSVFRDAGKINTTTVKNFLDYNIAVENIKYTIIDEHTIKLKNGNDFKIESLSMILKANKVMVNQKSVAQKIDDHNIIFWFDLEKNAEVLVTF